MTRRWSRWRSWPASLGAKLLAVLGAVAVGGSVAIALLLSAVITPGFARLERAAVAAQVARTRDVLDDLQRRGVALRGADLPRLLGRSAALVPASGTAPTVTTRADTLILTVPVMQRGRAPQLAVRQQLPRDLGILGRRVLLLSIGGVVAMLLMLLVALRAGVAALVLRPLAGVERHMAMVARSGTPTPFDLPERRDEIGSLVGGLNGMLRQFKALREQVEVQSFRLGQHENAVAVMHNVRNALNPISTILSHELASTPAADRALIERAVAELAGEGVDPERRRKLATFVAAGLEAYTSEQQARAASFAVGRAALNQVLEIVGGEREGARVPPPLAAVDLSEIVAQNAAIARYAGGQSIAFSFPSRPHYARANRVILSQVVGNLLTNAAEAIAATGDGSGAITVSIVDQGATVDLIVRDNGEGFDPAQAAGLFERGYSSRTHKSGGLGLHWCANAVAAMGGSLRLESAGPGAGACAVLTLPAAEGAALAA